MTDETRPQISRAALRRDLGDSIERSIFKRSLAIGSKIPAYDKLIIGDVILSRRIKPDFIAKNVMAAQIDQGHTNENARWTHAMLYVGALHVVESNKPFLINRSAVKTVPLTNYSRDFELRVLRHRDGEFADYGHHDVVRHGLLSQTIHPRGYDWLTALALKFARILPLPRSSTLDRINCSEFILECFAIGGRLMVEKYVSIRDHIRVPPLEYFLPADFITQGNFEQIAMEYYELVANVD